MSRLVPALFNTSMTQAIIEDRKTHTRRIIKDVDQRIHEFDSIVTFLGGEQKARFIFNGHHHLNMPLDIKLKYKQGDILYVRETWLAHTYRYGKLNIMYKADREVQEVNFTEERFKKFEKFADSEHFQASLFMPKEAARLFLKVTKVTVERLQDMTPYDASQEGIIPDDNGCNFKLIEDFKDLWNSTVNKKDLDKYSWNANPYVFNIEFEKISKEEAYEQTR